MKCLGIVIGGAALLLGAVTPALACNVGDIRCENGYRYVCKCWTATGCNFEAAGTCHRDTGPQTPQSKIQLPNVRVAPVARPILTQVALPH